MKKTVTANLAGSVFHIEEDAYEQLQRYLAGIRANFSGSAGAEEIMADIEARISELFTERLTGRNVVTLADVQHVEGVMGRPEDFAGDGGAGVPPPMSGPTTKGHKRLFRDTDDKWIGGVLSGLGQYIGMDPLWLRVAFIAMIWFGYGTPIIIYVLMWILVPKADTAAEKLEMRGEPVTVDNIKRVFEEGAERMKAGGERVASEARDMGRNWEPRARSAASGIGNVIVKLIGVAILIFAFSLLLSLITGIVGGTWSFWHAEQTGDGIGLLDVGGLLFGSAAHALWFAIGLVVLVAVPIIGLFLAGFRLLLNTRTPKWLGWSLSLLWFAALIPTLIMGIDLGFEFGRGNRVRVEAPITQPSGDMLYLDTTTSSDSAGGWRLSLNGDDAAFDLDGLHIGPDEVTGGWATCDVERSADSLYHLVVLRESRGRTAKLAYTKAENTRYYFSQEGDVLRLSPIVRFSVDDKLRAQQVHFTLEVPEGRSVFFRPGAQDIIYDIDNTTNTLDEDMIGRAWKMTARGLEDSKARKEAAPAEEREAPPADTAKAGPVAAVVLPASLKPRPAAAKRRPAPTPARVTEAGQAGVQLPNLSRLFSSIIAVQ